MASIKVLVLSGGEFEARNIPNTLDALQEIVGGYIEIPYISDNLGEYNIDIIINEEGKFIGGMNKEIAVVDKSTNKVLDIIFGNCIFASTDEDGYTIGLTEEQISIVEKLLRGGIIFNDGSFARVLYI